MKLAVSIHRTGVHESNGDWVEDIAIGMGGVSEVCGHTKPALQEVNNRPCCAQKRASGDGAGGCDSIIVVEVLLVAAIVVAVAVAVAAALVLVVVVAVVVEVVVVIVMTKA